ncbi:MAG: acetyl-CoA carboxylase biotin carboxylase subunit [Oscillospiraceae bacterium]|nr:acetyl-CoA carboxylase biotin carboxylase subunit [Oscillospiraceae bacterium]
MFKKILIANRGEIAVRIIRACRDMGIVSLAVYSEADKDALHSHIADESVCIGPAAARESYLNVERVISAALSSGADAIHPGYGFLSENSRFVELCGEHGITFIGPTPENIRLLGDKAQAVITAQKAGAPTVPGSNGLLKSLGHAGEVAGKIGYPVMLKASSGGGGRGIRLVASANEMQSAWDNARAEALACFGDDGVYLEKYIASPRHIEIQILADKHGNTIHLGERECSLQRRHQKVLEESPSPFLSSETRARMGADAVSIARQAGYVGAGTIEFLAGQDKNYYFMEMNPRIQVEHPVTELVTGRDIVLEQIRIALGEHLGYNQSDVIQSGHAIECRVCAEDPAKSFAPCPGEIKSLNVPGGPGVRVDSSVYQGYKIPPYYDSLIAKLIVHDHDRPGAITRMKRAMAEFLVDGVSTNCDFHLELLKNPDFTSGEYCIDTLEKLMN